MKHWERIRSKKEYLLIALLALLFVLVSVLSFASIRRMQGNARVVNYVGIVRGASQKLVKKELQGYPDDPLIVRLDSIVDELSTGTGPNHLHVLNDQAYQDSISQVQLYWRDIKSAIRLERAGVSNKLYDKSEEFFNLADRTVSLAESYAEQQVQHTIYLLIFIDVLVLLLFIAGILFLRRTIAVRKQADTLNDIAYIDTLTGLPNRASCNRYVDSLEAAPPEGDIAVFVFDMNNLKQINSLKGHSGGDRVIMDFARILGNECASRGFICRYGGDEFVYIMESTDESRVQQFLSCVNEKIVSYNLLRVDPIDRISFAVGHVLGPAGAQTIIEMIDAADHNMFDSKRQMKEGQE